MLFCRVVFCRDIMFSFSLLTNSFGLCYICVPMILGAVYCEWPALLAFMQTMLFNFGQSCSNLLTGLGKVDCGKHVFLPGPDFFARHNITHFSVRSLQALSLLPRN